MIAIIIVIIIIIIIIIIITTIIETSIGNFVIMFLCGESHRDVVSFLFGGRLIASEKKSGGVRPIPVS